MEELPSACQQGDTKRIQHGALKWVKAREGDVPKHTVKGGTVGEETVYIGRVNRGRDCWIPGIIVKHSRRCAYIDSNYMSSSDKYEALVCPYAAESLEWVETTGRDIPPNAVVGGCEEPGRPYYIGRTYLGKGKKKDLVPGKVDVNAGGLITCKSVGTNKVATFDKYEILVSKGEVQLAEEISRQTFCSVQYDTNPDAIKHTIMPNVALANVPVENESSLPQKIKTTTSLFVTETFSWSNECPQNMTTAIMTEYCCGAPYISFGNKEVCVTPDGVLPKQMQNPNDVFDCYKTYDTNILDRIDESQKVIPNVRTVVPVQVLPMFKRTSTVGADHILASTFWGNPILHYITHKQELSANVPPHTAITVVVEGTKHILEVPYVAKMFKYYKSGQTIQEEYHGTFQSTWFTDIGVGYDKEHTI